MESSRVAESSMLAVRVGVPLMRMMILLAFISAACATTTKYYTHEEDLPGTFIGNLSADLKLEPSEDPHTSFRPMQESNLTLVHLRPSDGLLTVGERIDRESLCHRAPRCLVTFDVVVFHKEKFLLIHVEIHVRDKNDHAPEFQSNSTDLEISENVAVGSRFPLEAATDPDVGSNYIQSYQLRHSRHFAVELRTDEDGAKHPELVLIKALDRELEENYTLIVTATDGGNPPRSGSMTVNVNVLDFNDNSPVFEHDTLKVEIPEDAPVGFLLLRVLASDPDQGANGAVRYDFAAGSPREVRDTFQIDAVSGAVTLKALLDYESKRSYELNIQAYDMGLQSVPNTCRVTIEVLDVNDNPPEIHIKPMTSLHGDGGVSSSSSSSGASSRGDGGGVAYIPEGAAAESFVALVSTVDRDSGQNGYVRLNLIGGHAHFRLQQAYGSALMVVTTATLDREKIPEYNLTFEAEDSGTPPFRTLRSYTVRVRDENDNAPRFSRELYEAAILENKPPGAYITTVVARDADQDHNGRVTYRLLDGPSPQGALVSSFVAVDGHTGALHTVDALNYEVIRQLDVTVEAADAGTPALTSTTTVRIKVLDQNDNAPYILYPVLSNSSARVPLPHNAPAGYLALRVRARDLDEGDNGQVTYRLLDPEEEEEEEEEEEQEGDHGDNDDKKKGGGGRHGDPQLFSMGRQSGELVLRYGLAVAPGDEIRVTVVASDAGRQPLSCVATVIFQVTEAAVVEEPVLVLMRSPGDGGGAGGDEEAAAAAAVDASLVVIALLGAGCVVLLAAIVGVAVSRWCGRRRDAHTHLEAKRKKASSSQVQVRRMGGHTHTHSLSHTLPPGGAGEPDSYTSARSSVSMVHEQLSTVSMTMPEDSYEEQSTDSSSKMFKPLLKKSHYDSLAVWQSDRMTSHHIRAGDQASVKDSGRGDSSSDFNDSDSETSGDAARKTLSSGQPHTHGSFFSSVVVDGVDQPYETPVYNPSMHLSSGGYTIAYSRPPATSSSYGPPYAEAPVTHGNATLGPATGRQYGRHARIPLSPHRQMTRAPSSLPPLPHRTATLPPPLQRHGYSYTSPPEHQTHHLHGYDQKIPHLHGYDQKIPHLHGYDQKIPHLHGYPLPPEQHQPHRRDYAPPPDHQPGPHTTQNLQEETCQPQTSF